MINFKYRSDIDGLRAVAVVLVLLFHAGFGFAGGFIGVDVFFVISGFLITGLILKEQDAGHFKLSEFWLRRLRRIVPAAMVMAAVTLLVGGFLLLPKDYENLAESTMAHQLIVSNLYFWDEIDYFAGPADEMPLLHTWSLAVEEQFYLFYPFLMVFLVRFRKAKSALILFGLAAVSFIACEITLLLSPKTAFYFLPTRAWEMLLGGLLCFAPSPRKLRTWQTETLGLMGMGMILATAMIYDQNTRFPGLHAVLPCLGAALLIYSSADKLTWVGKALSLKPVVFVGLISYSLYLWHWPLLAFSRYWLGSELPTMVALAAVLGSFGLAILSWKFVETPFRRPLPGTPKWRPVYGTAVAVVIMVAASGAIMIGKGVSQRFSSEDLRFVTHEEVPDKFWSSLNKIQNDGIPVLGPVSHETEPEIDFLVWGDSHARGVGPLVERLADEHQLRGRIAAQSATIPILGVYQPVKPGKQAVAWNGEVMEFIKTHRVRNVVMVARWSMYIEGHPSGNLEALIARDGETSTTKAHAKEVMQAEMEKTLRQLNELGVKVWIVGQVPFQHLSPPKELTKAAMMHRDLPTGVNLEQHYDRQKNVLEVFDALHKQCEFTYFDLTPYCFDETGISRICDGDGSYYRDDNHLSVYGTNQLLTPAFNELFSQIKAELPQEPLHVAREPEHTTSSLQR